MKDGREAAIVVAPYAGVWIEMYQRWEKILIMLTKDGYIDSVIFDQCSGDYSPKLEKPVRPVITLKGLEYLSENTLMKKAANIVRGIKETVPGL